MDEYHSSLAIDNFDNSCAVAVLLLNLSNAMFQGEKEIREILSRADSKTLQNARKHMMKTFIVFTDEGYRYDAVVSPKDSNKLSDLSSTIKNIGHRNPFSEKFTTFLHNRFTVAFYSSFACRVPNETTSSETGGVIPRSNNNGCFKRASDAAANEQTIHEVARIATAKFLFFARVLESSIMVLLHPPRVCKSCATIWPHLVAVPHNRYLTIMIPPESSNMVDNFLNLAHLLEMPSRATKDANSTLDIVRLLDLQIENQNSQPIPYNQITSNV